jgi:Coenzyme PQQ synthesis protein D (PqqD)
MLSPATRLRSITAPDGTVILDVENDSMISLNSTGGYVWERLLQGKKVDEICRELEIDSGVDAEIVQLDVRTFIEQLKSKRLLAD